MIHTIRCDVCGHTCTALGWAEEDTNCAGLNDDEALEDGCEHLKAGGEFEIIESEYGFDE